MHRYRRDFSEILSSSNSNMTKSRFLRLFLLSMTLIAIMLPTQSYVLYRNSIVPLVPYSWESIHGPGWSEIFLVPAGGVVIFDRWARSRCTKAVPPRASQIGFWATVPQSAPRIIQQCSTRFFDQQSREIFQQPHASFLSQEAVFGIVVFPVSAIAFLILTWSPRLMILRHSHNHSVHFVASRNAERLCSTVYHLRS